MQFYKNKYHHLFIIEEISAKCHLFVLCDEKKNSECLEFKKPTKFHKHDASWSIETTSFLCKY